MDRKEIIECDQKYFMNVFSGRYPLVAEYGEGIKLYDKNGNEYYDFLAGIGVNALGYRHPKFVSALKDQIENIVHLSNLYYIEPQAYLEKILIENSCTDKVFFTNSGAESNEGAMKLARKYFEVKGIKKYEIISATNSFHGRSLATLAATGQEKYRKSFNPLPTGFKYIPFNDLNAAQEAISPKTAAIIVEPVQGEGGVYPATSEYLKGLRELCNRKDILLIFDEIQCGIGRLGTLFAYEHFGIEPDILTLAKALGGGVPIGAFLAKEEVADSFKPGDHGSTFGGNHLATRAGYVTLKTIEEEQILQNVQEMGDYFKEQLEQLAGEIPFIKEVRGLGLMLALQFEEEVSAKEVVMSMFDSGFLINAVQEHALRFLPPLIVKKEDIDKLIIALKECLKKYI